VDSDELTATFDLRWQALALGDTVHAPGATLRPTQSPASTIVAKQTLITLPAELPQISLHYSGRDAAQASAATRAPDLEILSTLGEGGMGRVHLARQRSLDRDVAVKTLKPDAPERAKNALLAEAAVTGALEHPGIIPVHALGIDDRARPVLVMKRVEGTDWSQLIHEPEHPAWKDVPESSDRVAAHLEILIQVCNAVHFAHSRGIVHRDIKPENVMIGRYGEVYLVDWGIAARSDGRRSAELVGSPGYMAPEMVIGEAVDARTDVYLLGATLHEVLTSRLRHDGADLQEVLFAAFRSAPVAYAADVPQELALLCNRATRRERAERPQSALELRQAIAEFLRHKASVALAASAAERLAALTALRQGSGPLGDLPRAYRLMTECRFGLTQALEQWPDNRAARRDLRACVEAMVDVELRQANASGARALLAELESPPADLEARLAELERSMAEQRERDERLRRIEHDMDYAVGATQRGRALFAIGMVALAMTAVGLSRGFALETRDMVMFSIVMLAAVLVGLVFYRQQLFTNAFNRRGAVVIVLALAAVSLNRVIGFLQGSPVPRVFAQDLLLLTLAGVISAVTLARWVWPMAATYAAGLVLALALPGWSAAVFAGSTLVGIAVLIVGWRSARAR
jgi:serine/threonine-protein kinase